MSSGEAVEAVACEVEQLRLADSPKSARCSVTDSLSEGAGDLQEETNEQLKTIGLYIERKAE